MAENKKYYFISSLKKGMDVLELLAEHSELSVSQAAKTLGYNRAGAHRFLATLKELGYVDQNKNGHYELTFKILELSTKLASRFEIRKTAMRFMQELSKKYTETINLGFLEGVDVVHLEKINSPEILRIDSEIGSRAPAQHTALGKAILAFLPGSDLETFWEQARKSPSTSKSIVSRESLETELQQIKTRGYALDNEELCLGLRCIAVPIFDKTGHPRYSISISGPSPRMPARRIHEMEKDMLRIGRELSDSLKNFGQG